MVSFGQAMADAVRTGLCAIFATNEGVNGLLRPIIGDPLGFYDASAGLTRQFCSSDPDNDPQPDVPFTGGQCPSSYRPQGTYTNSNAAAGPTGTRNWRLNVTVQGPLVGFVPAGSPTGTQWGFVSATSGGNPFGSAIDIDNGKEVFGPNSISSSSFMLSTSAPRITNVGLQSGPDNCGDPDEVIPPPGPQNYDTDVTYNSDDDTEITIPTAFIFAPAYVDLDGSVNIPVTFDAGGIEFSGTIEVAPEFNFDFRPRGIDPGSGTEDDGDGLGEPSPDDPVPPSDDESDSVIVGVLVVSSVDDDSAPTGVFLEGAPNLYVPRTASVQFGIKTRGSYGWTSALDVKNLQCYVPCPAPQGAVDVRVSPAPGVTVTFTPVRAKPLAQF